MPTIQCRDGWRASNTPTPAWWGPPWARPLYRVPTYAVIAALRNGVSRRCHCLPGRCQGKLGAIEAWGWPSAWPSWPPLGDPLWLRPVLDASRYLHFPWVMVVGPTAEQAALTVTGPQTVPPSAGLVLVENATGEPLTLTVPPGTAGQRLTIKDAGGTAGTDAITVVCHPTVDGNPSYPLRSDFASLSIYWMGSQWGTL